MKIFTLALNTIFSAEKGMELNYSTLNPFFLHNKQQQHKHIQPIYEKGMSIGNKNMGCVFFIIKCG